MNPALNAQLRHTFGLQSGDIEWVSLRVFELDGIPCVVFIGQDQHGHRMCTPVFSSTETVWSEEEGGDA